MFFKELVALVLSACLAQAQELPGTQPLTNQGDQAALMLDGMHAWLDHRLLASANGREGSDAAASRAELRRILGMVGSREPFATFDARPLLGTAGGVNVFAARWPVLREARAELDAEGLYLQPKGRPDCFVVVAPDADETPEQLAGLAAGIAPERQYGRRLAASGCAVLIPVLIDRGSQGSGTPGVRMTNQTHREFVHRMAYQMGRHIIGYEVEKVLAAVDWLSRQEPRLPVGVLGQGEGGLLALYAGALDERIQSVGVSGYFGPREGVWREPLYRNVWGLLRNFGDAHLARLIAPRVLVVEVGVGPEVDGPPVSAERRGAASGRIRRVPAEEAERELKRSGVPEARVVRANADEMLARFLQGLGQKRKPAAGARAQVRESLDTPARQHRQFAQMVEFTQALVRAGETERKKFWAAYNPAEAGSIEPYREQFADWIGRLPGERSTEPVLTRQAYDTAAYRGYEVKLPVTGEVFSYGVLLVPKDIKPGERRPLVVAQHGLEGRPRILVDPGDNAKERETYQSFAAKLAERGYVVYAPQNPYIFGERFRQAQRKANPLGLTLFSFIVPQHARTLDWLKTLPMVDPRRIGFYGLSYGGFTAMRVPALLADYSVVICSGNFNEWTWKTTSVDAPYSYMFTGEYEIGEFGQGARFGHFEMARMIAPRPFMVERGHRDGVGIDEWVAYEYAKVARHYREMGIPERTELEYFDGAHRINGEGTFRFLDRWLGWSPAQRRTGPGVAPKQ